MPETKKEAKSCHQCGLEALNCELRDVHIPTDEKIAPCKFCVRNPKKPRTPAIADFYSESWVATLGADRRWSATIEEPTPSEVSLLKMLHSAVLGAKLYAR